MSYGTGTQVLPYHKCNVVQSELMSTFASICIVNYRQNVQFTNHAR